MKFYCDYCGRQKTQSVFPRGSMPNQQKIMAGIMVCDEHIQRAIQVLAKHENSRRLV